MRFFPAILELRRQIAEGVIGEVKYVYASTGSYQKDLPSRFADVTQRGVSVLEMCIYPINFATMIFGEKPESVHADGWLMSESTGVNTELTAVTLK